MKNIYTYIKNNQEVIENINELDALVFAVLSYIHIEDFLIELPIKIKDLAKIKNIKNNHKDLTLLKMIGQSNRFKNLEIIRYENILDKNLEEQFMAMTIKIDSNTIFISYRGTSNGLTGIKEALNLSYMTVPSQISAKKYLDSEKKFSKVYIGGHSKGGNLAMYAAINTNFFKKIRIKKVYNFDGPGFLSLGRNFYFMRNKIINFLPETSIVGRMMYNDNQIYPVKASKGGIESHIIYTWYINYNTLEKGVISSKSDEFKIMCDKLIETIPDDRRRIIIDCFYDTLFKKRILSIKNLNINKTQSSKNDIPKINENEKEILMSFFKVLVKTSLPTIKKPFAK